MNPAETPGPSDKREDNGSRSFRYDAQGERVVNRHPTRLVYRYRWNEEAGACELEGWEESPLGEPDPAPEEPASG